ncbi:pyridoxal phosphate-dependent aminotransferase [Thalassococcus sp. S3]|uniref:pyridoxal phosphate-dependent aminotransferase n=1 Tax=Thalassococcus sp. S3 TaxID=2017482 RepID=UPI0010243CBB|nr:pyridoxal phosphate-dependent aminotransferase [Thalassococcus sp. S3]QBF31132.1 histidinol-phosphate aminotransferase [Thalassococcus sp. S3]
MTGPRYTRLAHALPATVPFVGPEAQERAQGAPFLARLGANESVFGPPPAAIEVISREAGAVWQYGDPEAYDLKTLIARRLNVRAENIVIGEGIDALLGYLVRLVIEAGDAVVTSDGAYPTFNYHVAGFGGTLHKVPYRDDREDPEALFAKARAVGAKLVYLANPDNPMGSWHDGADLKAALEDLPEGCLLVLDEAYIECAPHEAAPDLMADDPRVIRMRTFSKAYGLAGLRIGYALGARDLIRAFDKVRNHFGVNRLAQEAAIAAMQAEDWIPSLRARIDASRQRIGEIAGENGLRALPSATNFVAVDCGRDGAFAKAVLDELVAQRTFVRMPFAAPQNRCIRVSCGLPEDLDHLAEALPRALASASQAVFT